MSRVETIEPGRGRIGALVHERRLHLVLWIALVEGILVLFGAIPWWTVLLLAGLAVVAYVTVGRRGRSSVLRESSWVAAVSQLLVVLVPLLAVLLTTLALVALVVVAVGALVLLVLGRR